MSLTSAAMAADGFSNAVKNLKTSIGEAVYPSGITCAWWIAPVCALIALAAALVCYKLMMKAPKGNDTMEEIAG